MTNDQYLNEIRAMYRLNLLTAIDRIAQQAKTVAALAELTYAGLTRRKGILFMYSRNTGIGEAIVKTSYFPFEILDTPSVLINWKRELDNRR